MKTHLHSPISIAALLLLSCLTVRGQGVGLYVLNRDIACQATVDVPVQVSGFRGMLTMQGGMTWDTSLFRFDTLVDRGPAALGLTSGNFGFQRIAAGDLYFSWDDPQGVRTGPDRRVPTGRAGV